MDTKPPTYEELLELTRRQARQLDEFRAEVERLKEELEQSRRTGPRQAAPFSKSEPKTDPKRPGRKAGPSLYQRYISGERVPVWDEMIRLGDSIHEEPVLSDALAVVREVVDRSHRNLRAIHDRLVSLGYEFANPEAALVEAGPGAVEQIQALEARLGTFPLLIREWYQRLASVDFSQSQAQEFGPTESCVAGLGFNSSLIMQSLSECWDQWESLAREHAEDTRTARESGHSTFGPEHLHAFLALGPSASNCDLMGFRLPNSGVDGVFYNDGAGDTYFIDHLRNVFEWGGFPFCRWYSERRGRHFLTAHPDVEKVLPILTSGLLPI